MKKAVFIPFRRVLSFGMATVCLLSFTASADDRFSNSASASRSSPAPKNEGRELQEALLFAKTGHYADASLRLFELSLSPRYLNKRMQLHYLLGLMLYQMRMYQLSAFQFISVIRDGNNAYVSQSLEKLSLAANELGDETLLNYAISRVKAESFPAVHRDMLFYRIGEYQLRNEQYKEAVRSFEMVPKESHLVDRTLYLKGLAYAEGNDPVSAAKVFDELIDKKMDAPVTDPVRVAAIMGKARALYQNKNWDDAIQTYREVPRDSEMWHDTLFESSWAMLRSGRFRSAISNFQSLHSPYYEETYLPESLLLRSIVYLYICQYEEMDKVLDLFSKVYRPVFKSVSDYLSGVQNPVQYFNDVVKIMQASDKANFDPEKMRSSLPYLIVRKVAKEGDFQRSYGYIKKLISERRVVRAMPAQWRTSALGKYSIQTLDRRIERARGKGGREIRNHMLAVKAELVDLFEQEGFIRYEMINGKKEQLKKRVAGKDLPKGQIDDDNSRDYYIQNGYEYWPFRGEYWLDELGNYHYVGTQSCE
jgi:tetratricopeptide (TPR) repeat protein